MQNSAPNSKKCSKGAQRNRERLRVERIIRIRDIRGNVLPKFIELCKETPCWSSSGGAPTWRTETNRNICYRVLLQKREFTPRGTHKH